MFWYQSDFFRENLGYSDDEIQQEVQNAIQFSERFGLDFSLTEPNELGLRFFTHPLNYLPTELRCFNDI